jgi:putative glutamine amidotransferase
MASPVIAISTYPPFGDQLRYGTPRAYVDAVRRAGGRVVLIPPGAPDPTELLELADGVVFAGGGDIDPARYGAERHELVYGIDAERDDSELTLAREVVDRELPLLAICRGHQILNVALGGTLHQHLPDVVGLAVRHRDEPPAPVPHDILVEPGTLLAKVMGTTEVTTQSWHHQATAETGAGLEVTARAPDGVIEAVELPGHPHLISVQWHPELSAADDPTQQALFDELVRAAGGDGS